MINFKRSLAYLFIFAFSLGLVTSPRLGFGVGVASAFVLFALFINSFNMTFVIAYFLRIPTKVRLKEMKPGLFFYFLCWIAALVLIFQHRGYQTMILAGVLVPVLSAVLAVFSMKQGRVD